MHVMEGEEENHDFENVLILKKKLVGNLFCSKVFLNKKQKKYFVEREKNLYIIILKHFLFLHYFLIIPMYF